MLILADSAKETNTYRIHKDVLSILTQQIQQRAAELGDQCSRVVIAACMDQSIASNIIVFLVYLDVPV